jgi:acetyl esterase
MRLFVLIAFLILCSSAINAQVPWLSTPESINQFRVQVENMKPAVSKFDVDVTEKTIPLPGREIRIRIYKPKKDGLTPALIYVHGACWVAGSLDSHDEICRYLSLKCQITVIAINYRLAPESKYPAAHDDVYEATQWIWEHAGLLGLDKAKFAIAGESTGAYFTAATALKSRDMKSSPTFSFQLLVYAALDGDGSSWPECKYLYFKNKEDARSDYGSPLWSKNLSGLPPTFNILGEYEISRAEEELFLRKLKEEGVLTQSYMYKGVGHDVLTWVSVSTESPAHLKAVEFIKTGFKLK